MKKINSLLFVIFLSAFFYCISAAGASAYVIENLGLQTNGDLVVGPGKTEVLLSPGDTYSMEIDATNVSGMTKIITFTTEDMTGTSNPDQALEFLGNVKGPYSIKDFVKPEADQVTLLTGQRVRMPVTISIPKDAEPGGLYGALMVSAINILTPAQVAANTAAGQINIITRVASLLFITVKGNVLTGGILQDFKTAKNFYEQGPVNLEITSDNTGNIHLDPYGTIEVKDTFGRLIDTRIVDPWFVMPKSDRNRTIAWNGTFLFGRYTAILAMNRGYNNIVDTKSVSFWVIPWKLVVIGLIVLILIIWFFIWIFGHIQWKRTPSNPTPQSNSNSPMTPSSGFPKKSEAPPMQRPPTQR